MASAQPAVLPLARSLDALRREIDALDDTMHDLLARRAELSLEVARAKVRESGTPQSGTRSGRKAAPVFRPGREAEILRRLVGRTRAPLTPALVARVWREIIVASICLQGRFAVAAPAGRAGSSCLHFAREHFGSMVVQPSDSVAAVIAAVAKGRAQLGILPLPGARGVRDWWPELPRALNIVGRLPFLTTGRRRLKIEEGALIVGRQDFEPSGDDVFYLQVERASAPAGLPSSSVRATAKRGRSSLRLIEIAMPFEEVAKLAAGRGVRFLGGYARPIMLSASS